MRGRSVGANGLCRELRQGYKPYRAPLRKNVRALMHQQQQQTSTEAVLADHRTVQSGAPKSSNDVPCTIEVRPCASDTVARSNSPSLSLAADQLIWHLVKSAFFRQESMNAVVGLWLSAGSINHAYGVPENVTRRLISTIAFSDVRVMMELSL